VFVGVLVAVAVGVLVGVFVGVLVGVRVGVAVGVLVGVLVGVFVGVGVPSTTVVCTVWAVLLLSLDSDQLFSGSTTTLVPKLVMTPADIGRITTVKVADIAPDRDEMHPPVKVTPLGSGTAL